MEIEKTNIAIKKAINQRPRLFRPPFGVTNPVIARVIRKSGMVTVGWSIRSMDTQSDDVEKTIRKVVSKIKPGSIILLHDNLSYAPAILDGILRHTSKMGYECCKIDELLNVHAYD